MRKTIFSTIMCAICIMCSFAFFGCGETKTFKQVSKTFDEVISEYKGVFFDNSGNVHISYASSLQTKINVAGADSLLNNLKSDETNSSAIFETCLNADVMAVKYYITWDIENYKNVPVEKTNELYKSIKDIDAKLYNLKRIKTALESASNYDNWIAEYRQTFYETIQSFNKFASQFIDIFEKHVLTDTTPEGRISVAQTQLEFTKKLIESASMVTDMWIKDYIDTPFVGDDVISNNFISIYSKAKNVFASQNFQTVLNRTKNEQEQKLVNSFELIKNYNSYYYNETKKVQNILSDESLKLLVLKETKEILTDDERVCLAKIRDYHHTFNVMKNYMNNYANDLVDFSAA